uniref:Uncharacterized protein n=1 Tax=viral metagenome TaxID=1070528 RepID=A0A6M3IM20_9ZZZZ
MKQLNKLKNNQVYYQQGGGDEQYTPKYGVEVLLPHIQHLKDKIIWLPFDKEAGNQPTFKASYFGVNFFQENIILADMDIKNR